jgi:hypothetical protein
VIIDAYQDRFENAGWEEVTSAGLDGLCTLVRDRSQLALPRMVNEIFAGRRRLRRRQSRLSQCIRRSLFPAGACSTGWVDRARRLPMAVRCYRGAVIRDEYGWRSETISQPTRLDAFRLPTCGGEPAFEGFKDFVIDSEP